MDPIESLEMDILILENNYEEALENGNMLKTTAIANRIERFKRAILMLKTYKKVHNTLNNER